MFEIVSNWQFREVPKPLGTMHIISLAIILTLVIIFGYLATKHHSLKQIDKVVFGFGFIWLLIEVYKQVFFVLLLKRYDWGYFPLQYCSVPIYFALIVPWIKHEKIKLTCYYFLASYGLLAGIIVLAFPQSVFVSYITICIHTMIWHGAMIVLGFYLAIALKLGKNIKQFLFSTLVFLILVFVVQMINIIAYQVYFKNTNYFFNLFYFSPYYDMNIVVFGSIRERWGWPLYFCGYIMAVITGSFLVWLSCFLCLKIFKKKTIPNNH